MSAAEFESRDFISNADRWVVERGLAPADQKPGRDHRLRPRVAFVIAAVFAPLIAPYGPLDQNLSLLQAGGIPPGPSADHILGVDLLGRDVFTRILYGARYSLLIGVVSVAIGLTFGLILGSISGYIGGYVDGVIMRRWTSCSRSRACSSRSGSSRCSARACGRS